MTKEELSQLYWLKHEIKADRERLMELENKATSLCAMLPTGMPGSHGKSDKTGNYAAHIADLKVLIERHIERCWDELCVLNRYIENIEDSMMRQIFTYRYVSGLTWYQVAMRLGGGNTDDGVRKAHDRYLKKNKACPSCPEET